MNNLFKKSKLYLALAFTLALGNGAISSSYASEFVVNDIKVEGLNRVTVGAVLLALPIKQGDTVNEDTIALALKRLYATKNFDDVAISRNGSTLVVSVTERPTIGDITFAGNSQVQTDALTEVIEGQGIRTGEALNVQSLAELKKSLEDFYHAGGMYQAKVNPVLTYLPRNRVDIKLEFEEGVGAEIEQINIVGNKAFDEEVLLAQMELRDYVPWWNFFSNRRFVSQTFGADLEALKSFYLNRGYVKFKIDNTSVEMTPDRKGLYLTIGITEGDKYDFGTTSLEGNLLKYKDQMQELLTLEEGETYSATKVTETEKMLRDFLGKYGYANSKVTSFSDYDEKNHKVNLTFFVDPGSRVYVNQINITGNDTTNDVVIRRELRQMDGTWLSNEAIETSKTRLNRTGFFETAEINVVNQGPDTATVDVKVKEQPTGSISGGIGYGTSSGVMIQAGISQNNVFGWGSRASISAYDNDYRQRAEILYVDPYFWIDQISLGGSIYYDKFDGDEADVIAYDNETIGFDIRSGYPVNEQIYVNYSLGFERNYIENTGRRFEQSDKFWRQYGVNDNSQSGDFYNILASAGISRNNLDRTVFPTSGSRQSFSALVTTPGSDLQYYKLVAEGACYFPFDSEHDYVLSVRGRAAYGNGYGTKNGADQRLPYFENFYLGGNEWLRGFKSNSIGPQAVYRENGKLVADDTAIGGNALWAASVEFIVPTPFAAAAYKNQLRTSVFVDAGALWDTKGSSYKNVPGVDADYDTYRVSAGVSVQWMSPIGPLVFSLAKAVKDYDSDETEVFNFNIGGSF